jgi:hypothetical protein
MTLKGNFHRRKSDADSGTYSRQHCLKNIFRDAVFRLTARTPIGADDEKRPISLASHCSQMIAMLGSACGAAVTLILV